MRTRSSRLAELLPIGLGLVAASLPAFAVNLNNVPSLVEPQSRAGISNELSNEDSWGEFWNGPGGFRWKDFSFGAGVSYRGFYTDNALALGASSASDFLNYVTPRLTISRGFERSASSTSIYISYQPTFVLNTEHPKFDRTYQNLRALIDHSWMENHLSLDHTYQKTSEASAEASRLVAQDIQRTIAEFQRPLTGKISLTARFEQELTDSYAVAGFADQSVRRWQGSTYASMDLYPKTTASFGVGGGFSDQGSAGKVYSFTNERVFSRLSYQLSGKLVVELELGLQLYQSLGSKLDDPSPAPVFGGSVTYQLREGTSFQIAGNHSTSPAQLVLGEMIESSGLVFGARQRIYQDFSLTGNLSYQSGHYLSVDRSITPLNRDYELLIAGINLQYQINARLSTGIFYQYYLRDTRGNSSIQSNEIGLTVDIRF